MSSIVDIYNLSLAHLGTKSNVSSISEDSNEARQCGLFYELSRDHVLRAFPWSFAQKRVALALYGTAPQDWGYQYGYPADCVMANEIVPASRASSLPTPFTTAISDNLNQKVILCDLAEVWLRYTARITNTGVFDPMFVGALSWWLAALVARPLTGDKNIQKEMFAGFRENLSQATMQDRNEGEPDPQREAEHLAGRA